MLILDDNNVYQKYHDCLENVCQMMMDHYNFLLGLSSLNTEVDNFFYQEEFDTFKFYDV
jgi:hypothetical protein